MKIHRICFKNVQWQVLPYLLIRLSSTHLIEITIGALKSMRRILILFVGRQIMLVDARPVKSNGVWSKIAGPQDFYIVLLSLFHAVLFITRTSKSSRA